MRVRECSTAPAAEARKYEVCTEGPSAGTVLRDFLLFPSALAVTYLLILDNHSIYIRRNVGAK